LIKWLANLGMTCAAPVPCGRGLHATHIANRPALLTRPPSSLLHAIHHSFLRSFVTKYPSPSCCSPCCRLSSKSLTSRQPLTAHGCVSESRSDPCRQAAFPPTLGLTQPNKVDRETRSLCLYAQVLPQLLFERQKITPWAFKRPHSHSHKRLAEWPTCPKEHSRPWTQPGRR